MVDGKYVVMFGNEYFCGDVFVFETTKHKENAFRFVSRSSAVTFMWDIYMKENFVITDF